MGYQAEACFVGCSDARIEDTTQGWLFERYGIGFVDRIIRPGATAYGESVLLEIVELHSLHNFPEVVLAHHTDCGKLPDNDRDDHVAQMKAFAQRLHERLPDVVIQIALVHTAQAYVEIVETMFAENSYEAEMPE